MGHSGESVGSCLKGKLLIKQGEFSRRARFLLRSQLDACEKTGWAIWYPEFMGALAEGLAGLGRLPRKRLSPLTRRWAKADRGGERYLRLQSFFASRVSSCLQEAGEQSMSAA